MNIESCANTNWIPTVVSLPIDGSMKIIQIKELPLPTIGIYNTIDGKWIFCQSEIDGTSDWEVVAWRNMPEPYVPENSATVFRSANETRDLSLNMQRLMEEGSFNAEFYHIRMCILDAAMSGRWTVIEAIRDASIKQKLLDAGFTITPVIKDLYEIGWGEVAYDKENEEHYKWRSNLDD